MKAKNVEDDAKKFPYSGSAVDEETEKHLNKFIRLSSERKIRNICKLNCFNFFNLLTICARKIHVRVWQECTRFKRIFFKQFVDKTLIPELADSNRDLVEV